MILLQPPSIRHRVSKRSSEILHSATSKNFVVLLVLFYQIKNIFKKTATILLIENINYTPISSTLDCDKIISK